jgi:hypothetical protein
MSIIELKKNGPIAQRAERINSTALTEVGFIPGDTCGCKIYASTIGAHLNMIGIHSRSYGCPLAPQTDGVIFKTEQMTMKFDE